MFEYRAKVTRVVDGDTVDVDIDLGFLIYYHSRIRLADIDAPETRTRDLEEKARGIIAKGRLKALVFRKRIVLRTLKHGRGKFGRILGTLLLEAGTNVNQLLLSEGLVRPYE